MRMRSKPSDSLLLDADLKVLGLPMGPRRLVLAAIAELGKSDMPTAGSTPRPVFAGSSNPLAVEAISCRKFNELVGIPSLVSRRAFV